MQPLLVRSAGIVGIAGAIMAVIASDTLFVDADDPARQPAPPVARGDLAGPQAPVTLVRLPASAELVAPAAGIFEVNPARPNPPVEITPVEPAALAQPAAAPAPVAQTDPAPVSAADATAAPAMAAAPPPQSLSAPPAQPSAPAAAPPTEPQTETASLWPDAAVACPRDWVAVDGSNASGGPSAGCRDPASPESAALADDQQALDQAALERASEMAALQFVPRIPLPRPDPPPATARRTTAKRANWPADPPPNCGTKRAKWRYVSKVPTWYCR